MLTQMAAENNYLAAMADQMEDLIQITGAEGAALLMDGQIKTSGITPLDHDLKRLATWLDSKPDLEVFESRHLGSRIEWASEFSEVRQRSAGNSNLSRSSKLPHVVSAGSSTNGTVGWRTWKDSR